jgi:hypothetical protein
MDTRDALVADILDSAACIKKHDYQLRRTTRDLRARVAKCTEVESGILEKFIANRNKLVMSVSQIFQSNKKLK